MRIPRTHRLACAGLWTVAGSWSGSQGQDGLIPDFMIEEWGGTPEMVDWLVTSGLWERAEEGAQFLNWDEYQPTKASEAEAKAKNAEKLRLWREKKAAEKDVTTRNLPVTGYTPVTNQNVTSPPTRPVPSRPDPSFSGDTHEREPEHGRTGTTIPANFTTTPHMLRWAQDNTPNVNVQLATQKFKSHHRSVAGRAQFKTDWVAAWEAWLLSDQQRHNDRPQQFLTTAEKNLQNGARLDAKYRAEAAQLEIEATP